MARKKLRRNHKFIKNAKMFFAITFWIAWLYVLFFVNPKTWQEIFYVPFFAIFFITISLTLSIFFRHLSVVVFVPFGLIGILLLRLFGIRDYVNPVLITCLIATIIYFFTSKDDSDKLTSKSNSINQTEKD
jgi:hypothetical protein